MEKNEKSTAEHASGQKDTAKAEKNQAQADDQAQVQGPVSGDDASTNEEAGADEQEAPEKTKAQQEKERAASEQDEARNKEATGERVAGEDVKATTSVNAGANFQSVLSEAEGRGFIGGQPVEERFADEERQRSIRAGLMPDA